MNASIVRLRRQLPWLIIGLLALMAIATLANGLLYAFTHTKGDMYVRLAEYQIFRSGVYPHHQLTTRMDIPNFTTSVYPPYALPMFAAFFAWGGAVQGRATIELLSLSSLGLIAWYGYQRLRFAGLPAGLLGALAGVAISGNSNALAQGQFSILCMGLIVGQLILLENSQPINAGICWALAMIKPQIALPFALAFFTRQRFVGLLWGIGLLTGLSTFAFWHTQVSPLAFVKAWMNKGSSDFIKEGNITPAGWLAQVSGIDASLTQLIALAVSTILVIYLWWWLQTQSCRLSPLQLAGIYSTIGAVAFYHRNYDNIMLFPALLSVLEIAYARKQRLWVILSVTIAASLWIPQRMIDSPSFSVVQSIVWIVAGVALASVSSEQLKQKYS
jgi:Glycosyltransferase family 87